MFKKFLQKVIKNYYGVTKMRKKNIVITICTIFCVGLIFFSFIDYKSGVTQTYAIENYPTVEQYTESDNLLRADGSKNNKDIQDFASEVSNAIIGTTFDELAEVIPYQYLNSIEEEATYKYYGEEYGFYVAKETVEGNVYYDVLVIDFSFDFEPNRNHSDAEQRVGVLAGSTTGGNITNCTVNNSQIDVKIYNSSVGGISGINEANIINCTVNGITFNVSGEVGGITGRNAYSVVDCDTYSLTMNYYWDTDNGKIGGVVGYNLSNGYVKNCSSNGTIYWTSPSRSNKIYPAIGYVIGYNAKNGNYSNCSTSMTSDLDYHYWHFAIGYFDQGGQCLQFDNGKIGWQES